ncbi:MAG: tRNA (adenosine(37)-N6)-dimethylallyltransferase MiaA [Desulfuromonadaceae bacterium]|nr:tRNA (adenosine(37)-N6)-dimethylallyltransferase MiaA [Desulfuromonadaceae bacterium]
MNGSTFRGEKSPLLVIAGPTASGKTGLAVALASRFDIEVVSADSRQVYRAMDIGTAKATAHERSQVVHHGIDVVNVDQDFSVADFVRLAHAAIADIRQRGHWPVVVGGTGLYIRALTEGLVDVPGADEALRRQLERQEQEAPGRLYRELEDVDPELAKRLHIHDVTRIIRGLEVFATTGRPLSAWQREHDFSDQPYRLLKLAPAIDRGALYQRIDERVELMLRQGLVEEVRGLLRRGYDRRLSAMETIGYKQIVAHLLDGLPLPEAVEQIQRESRRYAKRQLTWLRRDSQIIWVDYPGQFDTIFKLVDEFLCNCR